MWRKDCKKCYMGRGNGYSDSCNGCLMRKLDNMDKDILLIKKLLSKSEFVKIYAIIRKYE